MLPIFPFADWELPPELDCERAKPADARVFAKFMGVRQDVLLREINVGASYLFFARAEFDEDGDENDEETSWVCAESQNEWAMPAFWPAFTPREEWQKNLWNSEWARVFFLENSLAFLLADGRGSWLPLNENIKQEAPFFWGDGLTDWKKRPPMEWLERLKSEIQNPDSDARFALNFAFWSEEARADFLLKCKHGSPVELRKVLRQIALSMPQSLDTNRVIGSLTIHPDLPVELSLAPANGQLGLREFMNHWEKALETRFKPRCSRTRLNLHSSARARFANSILYFTADCENVSAHERIEAHCNLREWARKNNLEFPQI